MDLYLNGAQRFTVPTSVADHFLGIASHDQLKVLLYILAHSDKPLTDTEIASCCKVRREAVEEAVVFWQDVNVLQSETEPMPYRITAQPAVAAQTASDPQIQAAPVSPPPAQVQRTSSNYPFTPSMVAERSDVAAMLQLAEQQVGRGIKPMEQRSFLWMHDYLGLRLDMILLLVTYCAGICKFSIPFMESIAICWSEEGIATLEQAEADIDRRTKLHSYTSRVMRIFQVDKNPTPKQREFIQSWEQAGFSFDLIELAFQRMLDNGISRLSFPYIDKVLRNWQAEDVHTPQEAAAKDTEYQEANRQKHAAKTQPNGRRMPDPKPFDPTEHSYDLADFENLMNQF